MYSSPWIHDATGLDRLMGREIDEIDETEVATGVRGYGTLKRRPGSCYGIWGEIGVLCLRKRPDHLGCGVWVNPVQCNPWVERTCRTNINPMNKGQGLDHWFQRGLANKVVATSQTFHGHGTLLHVRVACCEIMKAHPNPGQGCPNHSLHANIATCIDDGSPSTP